MGLGGDAARREPWTAAAAAVTDDRCWPSAPQGKRGQNFLQMAAEVRAWMGAAGRVEAGTTQTGL